MGRRCSICTHPKREEIDKAILTGSPYATIAERFEISEAAISRHKNRHLSETIAKANEAAKAQGVEIVKQREVKDLEHALNVVGQLQEINAACQKVLRDALEYEDPQTVLKAADRVLRQLDFQAELVGDLDRGTEVNVTINQQWVEVRTVLMDALDPYPEARESVSSALVEYDS